jgi:hypothetical protein
MIRRDAAGLWLVCGNDLDFTLKPVAIGTIGSIAA